MKKTNFSVFLLIFPIVSTVLIDECIKFIALKRLPEEGSLVSPGIIDFAIHKNFGVAFDIPFQMPVIIIVSMIIGAFLINIVRKNLHMHPEIAFSSLMIMIGASGNLYDRLMYGFTVDYIIIFGRLAINLSDIVIVAGVVWLLMASRRTKNQRKSVQTNSDIDNG